MWLVAAPIFMKNCRTRPKQRHVQNTLENTFKTLWKTRVTIRQDSSGIGYTSSQSYILEYRLYFLWQGVLEIKVAA